MHSFALAGQSYGVTDGDYGAGDAGGQTGSFFEFNDGNLKRQVGFVGRGGGMQGGAGIHLAATGRLDGAELAAAAAAKCRRRYMRLPAAGTVV
jgi:hypothetical protein